MTFGDIIKNSLIENYGNTDIGTSEIFLSLIVAWLISVYIFFCYRLMTRKTFYSKTFNLSLIALCLITTGIILTIQSSLIVSLGMVGALSIVRFRTAVKDPMDLVFLFWAISVGIICGAGLFKIAIITTLVVTVAIVLFDHIPLSHPPVILNVCYDCSNDMDEQVLDVIKAGSRYYSIKSKIIRGQQVNMICELRAKPHMETGLPNRLSELNGVYSASLLSHDGEVTY